MFYKCAKLLDINTEEEITEELVKKQFRKKALQLHPDINKSSNATATFKEVKEAYDYMLNNYKCKPIKKAQQAKTPSNTSYSSYNYQSSFTQTSVAYYNVLTNGIAVDTGSTVNIYWITGGDYYYSCMNITRKEFEDKKYKFDNIDNYGRAGHYIEGDEEFFYSNINNIIRGLTKRDAKDREVTNRLIKDLLSCKNISDAVKSRIPRIIEAPKQQVNKIHHRWF